MYELIHLTGIQSGVNLKHNNEPTFFLLDLKSQLLSKSFCAFDVSQTSSFMW